MNKERIKKKVLEKGFLLTLSFSILGLFYFFPTTLLHPNSVYFDVTGDGFQTYFTTLFQANYETSWYHNLSMNYPYGENVFFTGVQPVFIPFIKLFGLGSCTVGILNLCMLFSFVIGAAFFYFIFKELEVNYLFAALAAVCIAFLSPQAWRLQFHFALVYPFFIPAAFYLLLLFKKRPSISKSVAIALLSSLAAFTQMYFFIFIAAICFFYWVHYFLSESFKWKNLVFSGKHFFIQIIIPYLLLFSVLKITDGVIDRTISPWGFMIYRSNIYGVFYPLHSSYTFLVEELEIWAKEVNGEGVAYIGIGAVMLCVALIFKSIWKVLYLKMGSVFSFTDNSLLNAFLWCGIFCLLFSFGWPFVFDHEDWLKKLGPIRQMRASGRFSWIFFYIINIVFVYTTYHLVHKWIKNSIVKTICFALILFPLALDAYENISNFSFVDTMTQPEMDDKENKIPSNVWVTKINPSDFQAILSLPYFHEGSENMYYGPKGNIKMYSFIASLKTKLPLLAVSLSRTSLSQTFKSIELFLEPNGIPEILNELPNNKPFLVIADTHNLVVNEKQLLGLCTPIAGNDFFWVYRLEIDSLKNRYAKSKTAILNELNSGKRYTIGDYLSSDSVCRFCVQHYSEKNDSPTFYGFNSIKRKASYFSTLADTLVKDIQADSTCFFSFWMHNFKQDLFPRTSCAIEGNNTSSGAYNVFYSCVKDFVKRIDGEWVLIEIPFKIKHQGDRIKGVIWNGDLDENENLTYSEAMIRQASVDIYKFTDKYLYKNNRYFSVQKK